jgi:hypothetical protein
VAPFNDDGLAAADVYRYLSDVMAWRHVIRSFPNAFLAPNPFVSPA